MTPSDVRASAADSGRARPKPVSPLGDVRAGAFETGQLDRDESIQLRIERLEDRAHAAGAERFQQPIPPDVIAAVFRGGGALVRAIRLPKEKLLPTRRLWPA